MQRLSSCSFIIASLVMGALLVTSQPAGAFAPVEQNSEYEIPLRQFDLAGFNSRGIAQDRAAIEALAGESYGGAWRVYSWNPQSGTPSVLYGSGVDITPPITSAADAENAARSVIAAHPSLFGVAPQDLRHKSTAHGLGKWGIRFQQTFAGLDVWRGEARVVFTDEGRLFVLGSDCFPDIHLNPVPTLPASAAEEIARGDLPFNDMTDWIDRDPVLLVLPVPLSETEVDHHLVWRVHVRTAEPLGIWVTHVDAHSGAILWRYNDVHFLDFEGDAQGEIQPGTYCNGTETQPLKYVRVDVAGVGGTITDQNGQWTVPYGGSDAREVSSVLIGPYIDVRNQAGPNAFFTGDAEPGVPFTVAFDDSSAQRDERDCFDAINDIHDFIGIFDPDFGYINDLIICNVSLDNTCNAFWDGTINFFREGGGCANTGEIQGVAHHEFGHGIQNYILGWQGDQGLGEGNSDVIANLLTQESHIGRGFYLDNCAAGIRNSDNNLQYPEHVIGQPIHSAGRVIAGFHWDLMIGLQGAFGTQLGTIMAAERWHFGRTMMGPTTQPDQVLATFMADDNDGNLLNGTPNYDYLCPAAQNHGFDCPEVLIGLIIQHTPLEDTMVGGDTEILATIYSTEAPLIEDSLFVNVQLNDDPPLDLQLVPTGLADQYHAVIPGLTHSTSVAYYLRGTDWANNYKTHPPGAPAARHEFDIAWLMDPLEEPTGWAVNLEGTDTATAGIWIRADPVGTEAQPEYDHTGGDGRHCWVTENGYPGDPVDYNDVDNGATTVYTPIYDLTGATTADVSYWRWYSNNVLWNPNEDIWIVQVRNDGGPWVDIENTQDEQNMWFHVEADLLAVLGGDLGGVQLKFIASDLINPSVVEAAVDDLKIMATGAFSAVPPRAAAAARFAFYGARSNPVVGGTEITFQLPYVTPVELQLFDVSGRTVRLLAERPFAAGHHTVHWDGRDAGGQPVASGVYYCRLQAGEFVFTRTLVLNR